MLAIDRRGPLRTAAACFWIIVSAAVSSASVGPAGAGPGEAAYDAVPGEHRGWYVAAYRGVIDWAKEEARRTRAEIPRLPDRAAKRRAAARVAELRAFLEELERNDPPFLPELKPTEFRVGRVGRLASAADSEEPLTVVRVLAEGEVLVVPSGGTGRGAAAMAEPFKLTGVDTGEAVDGRPIDAEGLFRVAGTQSCPLPSGEVGTVFVLDRVERSRAFEAIAAPIAAR